MTNLLETATYQNLSEQLRNTESLFREAMNNWTETNNQETLELAQRLSEECRRLREQINEYLHN